jgi:hypothetical protein
MQQNKQDLLVILTNLVRVCTKDRTTSTMASLCGTESHLLKILILQVQDQFIGTNILINGASQMRMGDISLVWKETKMDSYAQRKHFMTKLGSIQTGAVALYPM